MKPGLVTAAVLIALLSISGWTQQGPPPNQVAWSEWEGRVLGSDGTVTRVLRGPMFKLRHPQGTKENPREDMPIMIFTIAQWNDHPVVSAAPIDPSEIGRNHDYVFAVPPRWNYDLAEGREEAEKILTSDSLHTFAPAK